jgi:uncharacterized protein (DUF433 family)
VGTTVKSNRQNGDGFYRNRDPRELPLYSVPEAAHYLLIPPATLRSWVKGRYYPVRGGRRFFRPVIELPQKDSHLLSFVNLVEAHVLDAIRRQHEIALPKVRRGVDYLRKEFESRHPLADQKMETDGNNLFVQKLGQLINISEAGQLEMRELVSAYLHRLEWDSAGLASRLYPFTRKRASTEPRVIVIDPFISFGKPVLSGSGIPTAILAERYKAGESIDELAHDYGRSRLEIEEAVRCELVLEAA